MPRLVAPRFAKARGDKIVWEPHELGGGKARAAQPYKIVMHYACCKRCARLAQQAVCDTANINTSSSQAACVLAARLLEAAFQQLLEALGVARALDLRIVADVRPVSAVVVSALASIFAAAGRGCGCRLHAVVPAIVHPTAVVVASAHGLAKHAAIAYKVTRAAVIRTLRILLAARAGALVDGTAVVAVVRHPVAVAVASPLGGAVL